MSGKVLSLNQISAKWDHIEFFQTVIDSVIH